MSQSAADPFNLERFLTAQEQDYQVALDELRAGRKRSHWIWYVFPQLQGLGASEMSQFYGVAGLPEAKAYLAHPVLAARLLECIEALGRHRDSTAQQVLGPVDALKLRSSLTLFALAAENPEPFEQSLQRYFEGKKDDRTLQLLGMH